MDATDASDSADYGETWYAATKVRTQRRPQPTGEIDVDLCVIGGGLAGLTAAREVARRGWSVALLEAGRIAARASGRNTGFVLPGFAADPDSVIRRVGFAAAKDLWTLSYAGLDYVRNAVRNDVMSGIDARDGWLSVSKTDDGDEFMRLVERLGDFGCEIEAWPAEKVRAVLHSERYFHAIHFPRAFQIHPLNYALGLAAAAERDGARIFEDTPALSIDPAGVRKRIVTPAARLRASHVVLSGNVQVGNLVPHVAGSLLPITTYVITTASLGPRLAEVVAYRGAVTDSEFAGNHYRIVDGDRLMWSGRATTWTRNPRRYVRALSADIRKTYPQLGKVEVEYAWSGTLGQTIHRMPQIGEVGPGVWLASGFGGHGLNTTALAGNLIANAIVDGDQSWRRFTPFEIIWAGGIFGRAATQLYYWSKRLRDSAVERRARAQDRRQGSAHQAAASVPEAEQESPAVSDALVSEPPPKGADSAAESIVPSAAVRDATPQLDVAPVSAAKPRKRRRKRREGAKAGTE